MSIAYEQGREQARTSKRARNQFSYNAEYEALSDPEFINELQSELGVIITQIYRNEITGKAFITTVYK